MGTGEGALTPYSIQFLLNLLCGHFQAYVLD